MVIAGKGCVQNKADTALKDSIVRTAADYEVGANQTVIAELLRSKPDTEPFPSIPRPSENESGEPVAQAIQKALALVVDQGATDESRLERFTGTIVKNVYSQWDFSMRNGSTVYRVRFDSRNKTQVFKRPEKQGAVQEHWSAVKPANTIVKLDGLVAAAKRKVVEAGLMPTDYMYIKYGAAGPRAPEQAPRETLEVYFEIAGEEKARRAIFYDYQFQSLTQAKIIKVHIPTMPQVPRPEIPTAEIPQVKIPEITDSNIHVQENEQLVVITLWSDILFDFDKWSIRLDVEKTLGQILEVLTVRYAELPFEIHGHTDSKGIEAYNLNLSRRRAHSVKQWLVTHGIQEERISIYAHGELQPIAPNSNTDGTDNRKGRQKNRRVEIRIHK
jgi:outer membrane protein OmpA-like peptidoglycan-associated protein